MTKIPRPKPLPQKYHPKKVQLMDCVICGCDAEDEYCFDCYDQMQDGNSIIIDRVKRYTVRKINYSDITKLEETLTMMSHISGIAKRRIIGDERTEPVIFARHAFIAYSFTKGISTCKNLQNFCNKKETAIYHSVKKCKELLETNSEFRNRYSKLFN